MRFSNRPTPSSSDKEDVFLRRIPFLALAVVVVCPPAATPQRRPPPRLRRQRPRPPSPPTTTTTEAAGFPVTIETATGPVTISDPPAAIVSLSADCDRDAVSPSGPATRWWLSMSSPTSRRRPRPPISPALPPTSKRSPRTHPIWWSSRSIRKVWWRRSPHSTYRSSSTTPQ